ncbi:hypothetical protein VitviT2T_004080 [Vitis vinifera]|uniref:Uncharacterized protein n=1 Tax=Vitis vinifera TaxID=29760 RepID=A0ABY9BNG6_VITVI|nr:hypothetical protein VitviT2T_004080 [Vitis vinifera]
MDLKAWNKEVFGSIVVRKELMFFELKAELENSTFAVLSEEIAQQTQRLRKMRGEELQGLKIEELLEAGPCSIVEEKAERIRRDQ